MQAVMSPIPIHMHGAYSMPNNGYLVPTSSAAAAAATAPPASAQAPSPAPPPAQAPSTPTPSNGGQQREATMADMATAMRNLELNNQMMSAELHRLRQQAAQANQCHAQGMHPNMRVG